MENLSDISDKRLLEAIAFLKSEKNTPLYKIKHSKMDLSNSLAEYESLISFDEYELDEEVPLDPDEYWVVGFYDGEAHKGWPVAPASVPDDEQEAWRSQWLMRYERVVADGMWRDNPGDFLNDKVVLFRGLAHERVVTFKTKSGDSISITGINETSDLEDLDCFESWNERDPQFEPVISLPEEHGEEFVKLAEEAYELLTSAMAGLQNKHGELSDKHEMVLAHAFMAGRASARCEASNNWEIAKKGYAHVRQQYGRIKGSKNKLKPWQERIIEWSREGNLPDGGVLLDRLTSSTNGSEPLVKEVENEERTEFVYQFAPSRRGIKRNSATQKITRFLDNRH
ncbi:MAG: hypothetical protein ACQKBY_10040 [Verrucomicrobiales bacterium]